MSRQIGNIIHNRLMHKAAASGPCIFGQCLGNHRYIAETRQGLSPLLRQLVHIEISRTTASPIPDSAALIATGYHTLDDGLDRGPHRSAGHPPPRLFTIRRALWWASGCNAELSSGVS